MPQSRQLSVIMFTDIVGYTAMMGNDERKAYALLDKNRQLQRPLIETYHGRWIKEIGDGVLASFQTVSDAVHAAVKIQEACNLAKDFQLRIGIHQGEIVFEAEDIFGNAVNIAARIQTAASPGCIFISEAINRAVIDVPEITTRFVKEEILRNVAQPVRMYQVLFEGSEIVLAEELAHNSIAVLPFANMSNDPEQEYFSDGISEEIINMLAQVRGLKVIGRTSSFAFKGKNLDLKLIGAQLKVKYMLEGSVRKSGNKLRITAQLIQVSDGFHLYSEKFDRELEDIFAIQDELSLAILNAIKIKLLSSEKESVLKKYTDNIEAYNLYLNARFYSNKYSPDGFITAIKYYSAAIAIDPNYAIAYSGMSFCYMNLRTNNWLDPQKCLPQLIQAANKSLELDDEIAESHLAIGRVKVHYEWKVREAEIEFKKAIAINPNSAEIYLQLGFCATFLGNHKEAIGFASKADSLDPFSLLNLFYAGGIYLWVGDFEKSLAKGKRMVDMEPYFFGGHVMVGASYQASKRYEEAIVELELAVNLYPDLFNLSFLGTCYGLMGQKMKARETIEKMKKIDGADIVGNYFIGNVYGSVGDWDTAFLYYDKAVENQETTILWVIYFFRDTQMDMKDPRVLRLFEKMGQPYL